MSEKNERVSPGRAQSGKENIMDDYEMIKELMQFYKENPSEFVHDIEMYCNSGNAAILPFRFLMSKLDEALADRLSPSEIMKMAYYAHDDEGDTFNFNRKYFYFNDAGNLVSTDNISVSDYINDPAVNEIVNNASHLDLCEGAQAIIDKWKNK